MTSLEKPIRLLLYAVIFYGSIKYILPAVLPFLFGLGVAKLVQSPASLLSERIPRLNRRICCVLLTAALMGIIAMLVTAVCCSAVSGAMSFCPSLPARFAGAQELLRRTAARADTQSAWGRLVRFAAAGAQWCVDFAAENYQQYLPSMLGRSAGWLAGLPALLTGVFFAAVSAFFACGDYQRIRRAALDFLPTETAEKLLPVARTVSRTVAMLLKTYGTLMGITFCELALGFTALRLMGFYTGNILTNALLIAIIDILPVLGTGTVLVPWGLLELLSGNITLGALLLLLFAVIGCVRNVLEPKLIARRMELPPFLTLAGVYIGGKCFGTAGIFAVPLAMLTLREWRKTQKSAAKDDTLRDASL